MFDYVKNKYNLMTYMYDFVTIQQVSGSSHVQSACLLRLKRFTFKSNVHTNSTPRYMQAVRNHIPVARCDRSPPALVPDYLDSTP